MFPSLPLEVHFLVAKMELTALFCRYRGEVADAAYIKSLNVALMQSRNEVESLSIQLNKAEQQVGTIKVLYKIVRTTVQFSLYSTMRIAIASL